MTTCQVDGDPAAPILLVGMAPGKEELEQDTPFVGGSGKLLWAIAKSAGITRDMCYVVNVIGEWPDKKNGAPSAAQIRKYRAKFLEYVGRSSARIAVPLGGDALPALTGLTGIEEWRGYLIKPGECERQTVTIESVGEYKSGNKTKGYKKGDKRIVKRRVVVDAPLPLSVEWIIPTLHPAGVLRAGRKPLPAFMADLNRVGRAYRNELRTPAHYEQVRNGVLPLDAGAFVVDVETMPFLRIGMAGYWGGRRAAWSAPLQPEVKKAVLNMYEKGSVLVAHNAQFDLDVLKKHGMEWKGKVFCTMFGAYFLQPDLYKGLNAVCSLYMDIPRWKHRSEEDECGYNLTDNCREHELYEIERELLAEQGLLQRFEETIMPAYSGALVKMTERGIRTHAERKAQWLDELLLEEEGLVETWQGFVGNVNPRSSAQVMSTLYGKLGLRVAYNKRGGESAERGALYEVLAGLKEGDKRKPVVECLLALRKNSTLLRNFARKPIGDDGCVHPYYLPITKDSDSEDSGKGAAGTGRIQARDPNIQQLPQSARRMVIPHNDTLQLVSFDFKQLELRIAAALAGDQGLLRALAATDPFAEISARLHCDRTRAKNYAYGSLYLGGPRAICNALRSRGVFVSAAEIKKGQDAFFEEYRDLWRWRQSVVSRVTTDRMLSTPFGRKRYFYQGAGDGPAACSFMCQGSAADVVWELLLPIEEACAAAGGAQLANIHDEALTELPVLGLRDSIGSIQQLMEREWPQIAPGFNVPVGIKTGSDWGSMVEYAA